MLKRILVTVAMIGVTAVAFGQGTVTFNTGAAVGGGGARVLVEPPGSTGWGAFDSAGRFAATGGVWKAQLYSAAGTGASEGSLTAAGVPVPFRSDNNQLYGTVESRNTQTNPHTGLPINNEVVVTPVAGGAATVQLRAWDAQYATYEAAALAQGFRGASGLVNLTQTGIGGPGGTPGVFITGLEGFSVMVPEPSTYALGALGLVAFLFRRRK